MAISKPDITLRIKKKATEPGVVSGRNMNTIRTMQKEKGVYTTKSRVKNHAMHMTVRKARGR